MGSGNSRPASTNASATQDITPLIIRNLTITLLELKLVERLGSSHQLPNGLLKVSSRITGRRPSLEQDAPSLQQHHHEEQGPTPTKEDFNNVIIQPFSEFLTTVHPPDPANQEQLRLTFEEPSTGHRYSAEIPGSSHRTIVLKSISKPPEHAETKEFTAIYLPSHGYLALFSSANLSTWMSNLDPSLPLSSLSIPGTHNSPTCHVALPSVRCQSVPIATQLANGVRFLDVRVSCPPFSDPTQKVDLTLVHSAFPVSLTGPKHLSSLLTTLYTFLAAHPSETLLLSLKREGTGRGTDADLHRHLTTTYLTSAHASKWYISSVIPTLAQARGKIILLRRFKLDPTWQWPPPPPPSPSLEPDSPLPLPHSPSLETCTPEFGIDASVWPDNVADGTCGSGQVRIQDYYGVGRPEDIALKVRFAQEGLERAAQRVHVLGPTEREDGKVTGPPPLFINFLSASSFFNASCWPDKIAVKVNPSMVEYLCMEHGAPGKGPGQLSIGDAATGIVVTDWVGHRGDWDLIRCIVGWNARLQLRQ